MEMRKAMPRIIESADELQHRMQSDSDLKKRQRGDLLGWRACPLAARYKRHYRE
jgi:hypothetical protein